jgi:hypothetical protein
MVCFVGGSEMNDPQSRLAGEALPARAADRPTEAPHRTAEGASKPTKSKHASLHGKFPQLKALTEADIDEATQIWEKVPHEF